MCLIFILIEYWNFTLGFYRGEQIHVSLKLPPGLGRTQGCGFWADKRIFLFLLNGLCVVVGSEVRGDIMQDKEGGPSMTPPNKHLKHDNAFKNYGWFLTRDDKHVLLKISTYPWMKKQYGVVKHGPKHGSNALVYPHVRKNMYSLGLGLDSLDI